VDGSETQSRIRSDEPAADPREGTVLRLTSFLLAMPPRLAFRGMLVLALACSLLGAAPASAQVGPCTDVQVIGLRGSGEEAKPTEHGMGSLVGPLADRIAAQGQDAATFSFHGLPYRAVHIGLDTLLNGEYFASKNEGSALLHSYLAQVTAACPAMKLVVAGYSQGAHAAGDQLAREPAAVTDRIAAFVMFGDPRFNPDAEYTWGTFDARRYGVAIKRSVSHFSAWSTRVFSFCNQLDQVCQGRFPDYLDSAHAQSSYLDAYGTLAAGLVAAHALDPAAIYPVAVSGAAMESFRPLAAGSGGELFEAADPSAVSDQVVAAVEWTRPPFRSSRA
jgi:acetylxylan esterase